MASGRIDSNLHPTYDRATLLGVAVTGALRGSSMSLNKKQRIAVCVGASLIVLAGLFPPFRGTWKRPGRENQTMLVGRSFILSPPTGADVREAFGDYRDREEYYANVIASRVWIEFTVIATATVGAVVLLGWRRKDGPA